MSFSIRSFNPRDLVRLLEITTATFEEVSIDRNMEITLGSFGEGGWSTRKIAAVTEDCRIQPDGVFVAIDSTSGEVIGYITTRLNDVSRIGWIPNLAVDPDHQASGVGTELLYHAIAFLKDQGMEIAKIETLEQNSIGQKLYPRFGFQPVAKQIHYAMRLTKQEEPR